MRKINPDKLLHSKWTAVKVTAKRKHFLVTRLIRDEADVVIACEIEAVIDHFSYQIDWSNLRDTEAWIQGWK